MIWDEDALATHASHACIDRPNLMRPNGNNPGISPVNPPTHITSRLHFRSDNVGPSSEAPGRASVIHRILWLVAVNVYQLINQLWILSKKGDLKSLIIPY